MRCFQAELFSRFLPSSYAGHVHLARAKPLQFMLNCKYGSLLKSIFFVFNISFLPKYRVKYNDYNYGKLVEWDIM